MKIIKNKHTKAFRCRIGHTGEIIRLKKNWKIQIGMSKKPLEAIDSILKKYPSENIVIKSELSASSMLFNSYIRNGGAGPPLKNTTKWLYLIKSDGTVWTIIDKGLGNRFVGKQVR